MRRAQALLLCMLVVRQKDRKMKSKSKQAIGNSLPHRDCERPNQPELMTAFDRALTHAVLEAHNKGLHPPALAAVMTNNVCEYIESETGGQPKITATTVLWSMAQHFSSHLPEEHEASPISIELNWPEDVNDGVLIHDLLSAVADWIFDPVPLVTSPTTTNPTKRRQ